MWPVRNDAYEMMLNREILTDTYVLMLTELEQMINYFGLSTAIYTQTTDVEHEINGLVTYDRKVEKMDLEKVKYINQEVIKCTRAIVNLYGLAVDAITVTVSSPVSFLYFS